MSTEEQIGRRRPLMEYMSNAYSDVDGIVIGFGLVIEYMTRDGERGLHKMTSDASGKPLPYHAVEGFASAMDYMDEFDEHVVEDE